MTTKKATAPKLCTICGGIIRPKGSWLDGNNAEPVARGRCCDDCNLLVVVPARLGIAPILRG